MSKIILAIVSFFQKEIIIRYWPDHPHLIKLDDFLITTKKTIGSIVIGKKYQCMLCGKYLMEYERSYWKTYEDYSPVWMNSQRTTKRK